MIQVGLTEYQCHRVCCPGCGECPRGELPGRGLAQGTFGLRFQAAVATLSVGNRISRRDVVELCEPTPSARSAQPSSTASSASAANPPGSERRIERHLPAHTTRRLQRRSLSAYLTDTLTTHARSNPIPTLT